MADGYELFDIDDSIPFLPRAKRQVDEEENRRQKEESVGELVKTVENVSIAIPERFADPPSICEVPEELTEGSNGAYIPKVVCIGPLFDSKRKTDRMARLEHYKWCCVRKFIVGGLHPAAASAGTPESEAWSPSVHEPLLRDCLDTMTRLLPRIRASYNRVSPSKDTSDEELVTNVLLDGCFILQRLLKYARMAKRSSGEGNDDDDEWTQLIGQKWVWGTVKRDLLVLGNQVPFFVLRKLFKHLGSKSNKVNTGYDGERDDDILLYGGLQLFSSFHPRPLHASPIARHDVHHLLHLFYLSIDLPRSSPWHSHPQAQAQGKSALPPDLTWWAPSAKDLDAAGVRIRARDDGTATSFLDVKFHRGVLEIPPLKLFDYSETLFRNLIAFEQTYPFTPGRITTYAILMDCLLKTDEDVRLLHQSGVLVNRMNGERKYAAMGFFSRLCAEARTSANRNHLADVMEEVVRYYRGRWPRWRAALVTNPWVTTSLVASAVLLGLTVLQTYYTAVAYYKPTK